MLFCSLINKTEQKFLISAEQTHFHAIYMVIIMPSINQFELSSSILNFFKKLYRYL